MREERESVTIDEIAHTGAGVSYLQTFDMRLNEEHPPLAKVLAAIPLKLGAAGTELRQRLGESLASIQRFGKPLDEATTPSLEALKAFTGPFHATERRRYRFHSIPPTRH